MRYVGHIGLANNEVSAILDPIDMVKLCADVTAAILLSKNNEMSAILNNIVVVKLGSDVTVTVLDWETMKLLPY